MPSAPNEAGVVRDPPRPRRAMELETRGRSILDTMRRLELAALLPAAGTFERPRDPQLAIAKLHSGIATLREKRSSRLLRPPTAATLERALTRWAECSPDVSLLGARFTRALCAHPPMLSDEAFLAGLVKHPELPRRRRWLESLLGLYEAFWPPHQHAARIERLLHDAITQGGATSARLDRLRPLASRFFSPNAANWIAETAANEAQSALTVLDSLGVPQDSALARASVEAAARAWAGRVCSLRSIDDTTISLIEYGLQALLPETVIESSVLRDVMNRVIEWVPESDERIAETLRRWLLGDRRFGDPRLPANQPHWATMSTRARERMLRWLAKGDLLFFFDFVLPTRLDPHGRKQFWLKYIDQVIDSAVALSPWDAARLRLSVTEKLRYAHASSASGNVSAFVMRFRGGQDFVVAEFSQTGNAAYIHDAEHFDRLTGGMRARAYSVSTRPDGLKSSVSKLTKYNHNDGWEWEVGFELAHLGIHDRSGA